MKRIAEFYRSAQCGFVIVVFLFVSACAVSEEAQKEHPPTDLLAKHLVEQSAQVVERLARVGQLKHFKEELSNARAVVIFPNLLKGGFFFGGEAGNGVLVGRNENGKWGYPIFYTVTSGSFGLQFGVQDTTAVLIVRNDKALRSILEHQGKVGGDASVAIGFIGVGLEASTTTSMGADIVVYGSPNIGAYMGASLEGGVFVIRRDMNEAYYGSTDVTPDGVLSGHFLNPHANRLRDTLVKP